MVRTLLVRGMLVGVVAGLLAFGFAKIFGEPQVDLAIAFEEQHEYAPPAAPAPENATPIPGHGMAMDQGAATTAADHGTDAEIVSRPVQASIGLLTGVVLYSAAFGGLFAMVYAFAYGRIGPSRPRQLAILIAGLAFVALVIVPMLKYPANPPAVGQPDTIGIRTTLFWAMILVSIGATAAAILIRDWLAARLGTWNATLVAGASFVAIVAIAMLLLPPINEVPGDFPATVLWRFRVASLGTEVVMWATIGLLFGALTERADRRA